jgi:hypothetical protein
MADDHQDIADDRGVQDDAIDEDEGALTTVDPYER